MKVNKTIAIWAAALVGLACAGSLRAHHSGSMYDTTPIWVKGTVVRIELVNPHTVTTLDDGSGDREVSRWAVEGPGQSQLDRMGIGMDVAKVGDIIEFCAFAYKPAAELSRMFPGVDFSARRSSPDTDPLSPQLVAGHVMVMPDGEKRLWKSHGKISECIRSTDDQRQSWLDLLNADSRAWQAWCQQREMESVQLTVSSRELVEEINGLIDSPCE
jgi:hypothetical protein